MDHDRELLGRSHSRQERNRAAGGDALGGGDLLRVVERDPPFRDQPFETLGEVLGVALGLGELG
jgi:hypothetical protein